MTPLVDDFEARLDAADLAQIARLDADRLRLERSRVAEHIAQRMTDPVYNVFNSLRKWERLISAMEQHWPRPYDHHLVQEYLNELCVRDSLGGYLDKLNHPLRGRFALLMRRLDDRFREVTVYDGGKELSRYWKPLADGRESRWWWVRRPIELSPGW